MSELPLNVRQRRLVRATFLRAAHVGVVIGGTMGTREEYELLREAGGFIIPIGASGGTAFALWSRLIETYAVQLTADLLRAFEGLGNPLLPQEEQVNAVMRLVDAKFALRSASRAE